MKKVLIIISGIIILFIYAKIRLSITADWLDKSLITFLGVDEFGRDNFAVAILSSINSMVTAIALTLFAFITGSIVAFSAILAKVKFIKTILHASGTLIESCPVIVWLFVIIVGFRDYPRFVIVSVTFILAAIPYLSNVIFGELERLWHADFIESARIAGLTNLRIGFKYLLPNTLSVITPVLINVYGAALTVNGVIGVLGMGNRMDLEIGTLLLRGKENITTNPQIMLLAILSLITIYFIIILIGQEIKKRVMGERNIITDKVMT